jgi:hypothetical protein
MASLDKSGLIKREPEHDVRFRIDFEFRDEGGRWTVLTELVQPSPRERIYSFHKTRLNHRIILARLQHEYNDCYIVSSGSGCLRLW